MNTAVISRMFNCTWIGVVVITIIAATDVDAAELLPSTPGSSFFQESQDVREPVFQLDFDAADVDAGIDAEFVRVHGSTGGIVDGLDGKAMRLSEEGQFISIAPSGLPFQSEGDYSVQFWVRTTADDDARFVIASQKEMPDFSLASQKHQGWVFAFSNGTWAWNVGSGGRRLTYERDNGEHMPLNDGRWHLLTMTYNKALSEIRLFYDGINWVSYHVSDAVGFEMADSAPLQIGWESTRTDQVERISTEIERGAELLQQLVDRFNAYGLKEVQPEEFADLIVDPASLFERKVEEVAERLGEGRGEFVASMDSVDFEPIRDIESRLMKSPYTVHQALTFMEVAPLLKVFSLSDGRISIDPEAIQPILDDEQLDNPDFDIDNLSVWDRVISRNEVLDSYSTYFRPTVPEAQDKLSSITAAAWNIFHGGKHFNLGQNGWDSRKVIADIIKREGADIVMMQETYSSGDFIAAELGYYFATTVDWDYLNQGANISVLSRYPIKDVHVPDDSPFMNVAATIAISKTQDIHAMSNWYGMQQFESVFEFHEARFGESGTIPVLFGGDFNAVPESDDGESLAARTLLEAGFTDAFRSLHSDVETAPGFTHRSGVRIDQLYYKGSGLTNTDTRLVTTWPTGFPSDHYLILSTFDLDYSTR